MINEQSATEELLHWERWQTERAVESGNFLTEQYMPLVDFVVSRFRMSLPKSVTEDDIRSFALEGLLDAFDKFSLDRELKFETYASWRIKGAIIDGLRALDWLPRSVRDRVKQIEKAYETLGRASGSPVTDTEVSAHLGITKAELNKAVSAAALSTLVSIDEKQEADTGFQVAAERRADQPEQALVDDSVKRQLADAIARLPEREKLVVSLCYFEELTLTEIAEVMGVSVSRISQLHSKAILRLRGTAISAHENF